MIIEFTAGQFMMSIGVGFFIIGCILFLIAYRNPDYDAELIIGIVMFVFAIIFIIVGLNVDYGFLVFKLVK